MGNWLKKNPQVRLRRQRRKEYRVRGRKLSLHMAVTNCSVKR